MAWMWQLLTGLVALSTASPLEKRVSTGACTGECKGSVHDPAVVYRAETDTYYRFTTNDCINTATAPSISGPWTFQGAALPSGSVINLPGRRDLWAPDVFESDGTFYLYYSVSAMGSQNSDIGVATSSTMDPGDWTDHGSIGIPRDSKYNRIDGNLFQHDADSEFLLTFGSFWQNIFQVPMEDPPLKIDGDIVHLVQNTTARPGLVKGATEGSYMFQLEIQSENYTYLFFSSGNCCNTVEEGLAPPGEEYKILVCRSSDPSGGFTDHTGRDCLTESGGTIVLSSFEDLYAPGGQGVMWDPQQDCAVVYYHYVKPSVGYGHDDFFFGWNKLDFSTGWPMVVLRYWIPGDTRSYWIWTWS